MSHLRIWRNNGIVYFAGQVPVENVSLELREGTFGRIMGPIHMDTLSRALQKDPPVPLRSNPFGDAKDQ